MLFRCVVAERAMAALVFKYSNAIWDAHGLDLNYAIDMTAADEHCLVSHQNIIRKENLLPAL